MKNIIFLALISILGTTVFSQVIPKEPEKQPIQTKNPNNKKNLPQPTTTVTDPFLNMEMVQVQGGTFTMGCTSEQGSECLDNEKPEHQVTLNNFKIGKYDVTQAQWQAVMRNNPSDNKGCDNCPVTNVSWDNVQEFIIKLNAKTGKNYRLPNETEWEYVARGGRYSKGYKYSGSNDVSSVAWFKDNSGSKTHPVGQKQPNELGVYDMSGNVCQWCNDWYGIYNSGSQTNSNQASDRVVRGGTWNGRPDFSRIAARTGYPQGHSFKNLGFRLVLAP